MSARKTDNDRVMRSMPTAGAEHYCDHRQTYQHQQRCTDKLGKGKLPWQTPTVLFLHCV